MKIIELEPLGGYEGAEQEEQEEEEATDSAENTPNELLRRNRVDNEIGRTDKPREEV